MMLLRVSYLVVPQSEDLPFGASCLPTGALEIDVLCCDQRRVCQSKEQGKFQSQASGNIYELFVHCEIFFEIFFQALDVFNV